MTPRVVVATSWPTADIAPPKLTGAAGAELTDFHAARSDHAAITYGCVATPIPGWVDDMRPSVEGRTLALAGASAASAAGHPIDARPDGRGGFELRDVRHLEEAPIGNARTFLGFDDPGRRVFTCFATCTSSERPAACAEAVDAARLDGSSAPPSPGLALAAATWAVHHPQPFALGTAVAVVVLGALAIALRRRPRFRGK